MHRKSRIFISILICTEIFYLVTPAACQKAETSAITIARLKYRGGGDWYNDPSAIPNLCAFVRKYTDVDVAEGEVQLNILDERLFSYPFLYMTGHGRIAISDEEVSRLRSYLLKGGFLYADDDYGMDTYFRAMMKVVFPERECVELPFSHGIYNIQYRFENGLPKIHEHDNNSPQGFGLFDDEGRLMVFYTFETNISDGWADPDIHNDPPDKRRQALEMGTNILVWALLN